VSKSALLVPLPAPTILCVDRASERGSTQYLVTNQQLDSRTESVRSNPATSLSEEIAKRGNSSQPRRVMEIMATAAVERLKRKLPDRIAQVRGDRSQRQFARDLGVFQQNVNRYESGTTPHTDFLITLAVKEQVSVDWLLLGKGKMRRSR
jgi:transcriptional regulator with XRE-family HTH domain